MSRNWLLFGAVYGLLAVIFGAFGAHALRGRVTEDLMLAYRTATEYQMYHALALVIVGVWAQQRPSQSLNIAGACFAIGVLLFSGSLYALALTGIRQLGFITPVGGLAMLLGWGLLIRAALATRSSVVE